MNPPIGIDLGTTNSLICVWQEGKPTLIPNAIGEVVTPSVVSIDEDDSILVGRAALSRLTTHPDKSAAAFKRFLGSNKIYELAGKKFTPTELSALVLKSLKADAEAFLQQEICDVVISVPAYFNDEQRKQTRFAAELAGLNAVRLINEPTAAAMAYGLHEEQSGNTLVFDLGGGTFDVTVLEYALPIIEVHASAGDNYLGGEDFTHEIVQACLSEWKLKQQDIAVDDYARLLDLAEQVKCKLNGEQMQYLTWFWQDKEWQFELNESRAKVIWLPLLNRLRAPVEQALSDARLKPAQLEHIVLVGGSSQLGVVRELVTKLFGKLPYRHINPTTIVAQGAAVQAACRLRNQDVEEVILTDVCPYTLGIESCSGKVSGLFSPIIERNTIVPTSKVKTFYSTQPQQKAICISVYQGENPRVENNVLIDEFEIPLTPMEKTQGIDVRFSYDLNGLLEVDVVLLETGEQYGKVIDQSPIGLTDKQKQESHERLKALKIHPRDEMPNRTLLARLERAWAQSLGDERLLIGSYIEDFLTVLNQQNLDEINQMRSEIESQLNDLGR
ncbi:MULTISPECIES: molecular chaperone HscC [unclassified Gilliamella]|uniref:molecular chaperone HscC n=1 Tax=unclassified Gilliamella TaxID=2685620 RepID=UPI002269FC3A|nr:MULTISPECIES: molecular chaperone HscC [unclassified Gilliamella]MCX8641041.1 molecular chaperone HscC [Gilliamella sp. B3835]MCX8707980.1 molecular chaperone HscC [Gilliamella sp. B3783]MCX8710183.1 molecular chaperone HscC [Gilliamella sp. B3780]MCX8714960.1 molecular chaperone HscC [Gilliamella sp. B3781]MCX8716963.1 molecular chaperone HscC [Gilliamella sp. B3784]